MTARIPSSTHNRLRFTAGDHLKLLSRNGGPLYDEFVSLSEAKNKLLDLIRRMKHKQEIVAITHDGVPSAVLLSMERFEGLMETIQIFSDQKSMRAIG